MTLYNTPEALVYSYISLSHLMHLSSPNLRNFFTKTQFKNLQLRMWNTSNLIPYMNVAFVTACLIEDMLWWPLILALGSI